MAAYGLPPLRDVECPVDWTPLTGPAPPPDWALPKSSFSSVSSGVYLESTILAEDEDARVVTPKSPIISAPIEQLFSTPFLPILLGEEEEFTVEKPEAPAVPPHVPEAWTRRTEAPGRRRPEEKKDSVRTVNFKGELNHIAQHVVRKQLSSADVIFESTVDADGLFHCTVTLPWADQREFANARGSLRKKDAEQAAAEVAVRCLVAEGVAPIDTVLALPTLDRVASETEATETSGSRGSGRDGEGRTNYKGMLNNLAMKVLGRPVAAGDVVYTSKRLETGVYQANVALSWLPGQTFESPPMPRKKDAEQITAHRALESLGVVKPDDFAALA
jgi:hypothetical protein